MEKLTEKLAICGLVVICGLFWYVNTASIQARPGLDQVKVLDIASEMKRMDLEPVKVVLEVTSDGIYLYHCYLTDEDYLRVRDTKSRSWHLGDPDCISGSGNCENRSSTERIVYHPV